ncbi:MAG: bifunctional [glutamate--ammonia ligase]-adenylyl-L-tyrosine phosphorylase/[glutamate--ammonia-ligase] adenylyltransferase, partial [Thermodesulfobacteriota bacterium]
IDLAQIRGKNACINVKLGRGGIREIEFFCQALQLIYGGKDPGIRDNSTLRAMEKLRDKGLLSAKDSETLNGGYVFLRNLEHRLQMVEGLQTQNLPEKPEEVLRIAKTMGFASNEEFLKTLKEKTDSIHGIFRGLFYKSENVFKEEIPEGIFMALSNDAPEKERLFAIKSLGFSDAETALKNALLLKGNSPFLHLSQKARGLLEKISPLLIFRASASPDPDMALSNMERFIASAGSRAGIYALLIENTPLITELVKIFAASAFLSNMLVEKPENLDILLSADVARPTKTQEEFMREMSDIAVKSADYEQTLDNMRRYKKQELFRIGTKDLLGELSSEDVSTQISSLAGASLETAYGMATKELVAKYGTPGDERFIVLGLGKLGGGELIYGSDLDIIFVYAENPGFPETSGPKVVSNHEFYAHAAQKMISILSLRTNEGFLFNVDARLRPSGSSGPLVVSKAALLDYQREKASVWERQALTRASAVAGDKGFGLDVMEELSDIVYSKELPKEDVSELLRIRKRMEDEIAKETETRFDIKAGKGGMVDVEFLAQALLLKHGKEKTLRSPNTLTALANLFEAGILKEKDYNALEGAYKFYRRIETRLRIVHDKSICTLIAESNEADSLAKKMGYKGDAGEKLISDYLKKREEVRGIYAKVMEGLSNPA